MNLDRLSAVGFAITFTVIGAVGLAGIAGSAVMSLMLIIAALVGGGLIFFPGADNSEDERKTAFEEEVKKLRSMREREHGFYELASTLSSTLDYKKVLESAQSIGRLVVRDFGTTAQIHSAALLFHDNEDTLRVVDSTGLTRTDQQLRPAGKEGALGLALKPGQSEPVFSSTPRRDPELQYFVGFQNCKSLLALPLRVGYEHMGVLVFASDHADAFSTDYIELLKAIGMLTTIAMQNARLYQNILNEKERIVEIDEDARKKLARDLHDGPTQSIAAIAMRVNYIRRLVQQNPGQAQEELNKVEDLARRTTKEIRHMLFTLRPLVLETQGLVAALGQMAEKMRETYNLNVIVEAQPNVERWLDVQAQGIIFYIVEEAVNNARKHAYAAQIWVRIAKKDYLCIIEVQDNGVGFDSDAVMKGYDQRGSLGMVNMKERAELVEGRLNITSNEGEGTKIVISVPVREGTLSSQPQVAEAGRATAPLPPEPAAPPPARKEKPKPNIPFASKQSPGH